TAPTRCPTSGGDFHLAANILWGRGGLAPAQTAPPGTGASATFPARMVAVRPPRGMIAPTPQPKEHAMLPPILSNLRIPFVASPMFIVSVPELVIAQCKAGIVGSFPALNAREKDG